MTDGLRRQTVLGVLKCSCPVLLEGGHPGAGAGCLAQLGEQLRGRGGAGEAGGTGDVVRLGAQGSSRRGLTSTGHATVGTSMP